MEKQITEGRLPGKILYSYGQRKSETEEKFMLPSIFGENLFHDMWDNAFGMAPVLHHYDPPRDEHEDQCSGTQSTANQLPKRSAIHLE